MDTKCRISEYNFPEAKTVVVSGDIHGDFNVLVNKVCVQYQMRDTLVIVAGDCGFGFERKGYYDAMVRKNAKRMNECNNWIVFVRGNHDNPAYFDGEAFSYERFRALPDYSVLGACGHSILCVGGAVSIDRNYRKNVWDQYIRRQKGHVEYGPFARNNYWSNEMPVFDSDALDTINEAFSIDIVVSHTAPSFCELNNKNGLDEYSIYDSALLDDVAKERVTMDEILTMLRRGGHPLSHWFYGHFHQSWRSENEGVDFRMLDIMEFGEIK